MCIFLAYSTLRGAREQDIFLYYLLIQYFFNIFCEVYVSFLHVISGEAKGSQMSELLRLVLNLFIPQQGVYEVIFYSEEF